MIEPGAARPLTYAGFREAASILHVSQTALWCVVEVETSGCGFFASRRPSMLFERHIFYRLTGGEFFSRYESICSPTPGGYGGSGDSQYDRLHAAMRLDERAALSSASWGLGQIMGSNFRAAGFGGPREMIAAFCESEDQQLTAMTRFISVNRLDSALRELRWDDFAKGYNGPAYKQNRYDEKLAAAHAKWSIRGIPDLLVRARQMELFFQRKYKGKMDGVVGPLMKLAEQS